MRVRGIELAVGAPSGCPLRRGATRKIACVGRLGLRRAPKRSDHLDGVLTHPGPRISRPRRSTLGHPESERSRGRGSPACAEPAAPYRRSRRSVLVARLRSPSDGATSTRLRAPAALEVARIVGQDPPRCCAPASTGCRRAHWSIVQAMCPSGLDVVKTVVGDLGGPPGQPGEQLRLAGRGSAAQADVRRARQPQARPLPNSPSSARGEPRRLPVEVANRFVPVTSRSPAGDGRGAAHRHQL